MKCPDHSRELKTDLDDGLMKCPFCHGALMASEVLEALVPGALAVLTADQGRPRSRRCPSCSEPMQALRIGRTEAWVERCDGCQQLWVEKGDLRTLNLLTRSAARQAAYASMSSEERQGLASGLAEAVQEASPPVLAVEDAALAAIGVPVMQGAGGDTAPVLTWAYSALLVVLQLGFDEGELAYRAGSGDGLRLISAAVSHFGWLHLIGNVLFMVVFGANAERRLPRWVFALCLVVLGPLTIGAEALVSGDGTVIAGASGTVAACLGMCLLLQRRARITVWMIGFVTVPLWGYGIGWAVLQVAMWALGIEGTAWVAHLAGFAAGLAIGSASRWPPSH